LRLLGTRAEITVSAEVDIASEGAIRHTLRQALEQGAVHILISFCGSAFVGGPAVRLALTALETVGPLGGSVTIRGDTHVRRLFAITGVADRVTLESCD
jgi:anti-anti-sigma factor